MLEIVSEFGDSLTADQYKKIESSMGPDLFRLLESVLDSSDEESARRNVSTFIENAMKQKLKLLALRRHLSSNQRDMLLQIWEKNEK